MLFDVTLHACVFSFLTKLTTSLDDLLWLSPFLARASSAEQRAYTAIYCLTCYAVTLTAWGISCLAKNAMEDSLDGGWLDGERLLAIVAFLGLSFLAFRDYREWAEERRSRLATDGGGAGDLEMASVSPPNNNTYNFSSVSVDEADADCSPSPPPAQAFAIEEEEGDKQPLNSAAKYTPIEGAVTAAPPTCPMFVARLSMCHRSALSYLGALLLAYV